MVAGKNQGWKQEEAFVCSHHHHCSCFPSWTALAAAALARVALQGNPRMDG